MKEAVPEPGTGKWGIKEQRLLDREIYKTGLLLKGPIEQGGTSIAKSIILVLQLP